LIRSLLHFRRLVETKVLEPEMVRQTPLAMSSYKYLFNSIRYPVHGCDTAEKFDPEASENQHIVVVRRNKFYEVRVVDESGEIMSEPDLEVQFKRIVEMAGTEADAHPVGALTTENRDVWADALAELKSVSSGNAKSLDRIHRAIIVLVLEDKKPVTRSDVSRQLWVGDGRNRFFDKHQLIVFDNGKSGAWAVWSPS